MDHRVNALAIAKEKTRHESNLAQLPSVKTFFSEVLISGLICESAL